MQDPALVVGTFNRQTQPFKSLSFYDVFDIDKETISFKIEVK